MPDPLTRAAASVALPRKRSRVRLADWEHATREAMAMERAGLAVVASAGYRHALSIARQLIETPERGRAECPLDALDPVRH
jgi:hypothetical protein